MARRVLYLSHLGGLGGGETVLLSHLLALDRNEFSPSVICGKDGRLVRELRAQHIPVEVVSFRVPYFWRGFLPRLSPLFYPRLFSYLRAQQIDLIHCNDFESSYYAAPLAKLLHIPLLWTCHGWWMVERGWKSAFAEKLIPHIMTPTQQLEQALSEINPHLSDRITIIPFGVDTAEFAPRPPEVSLRAEFGVAEDAPLLTMLARFQAVKGHAVLLDAAPQILDAFPNARFLLVGGAEFGTADSKRTRTAVNARVKGDARLRAAVVFAGFRRDIARILNATDVLVSPSEFETYGMAILEAMACGVPVVSTNVGGPTETMVDGGTGFLVEQDADALAKGVIDLLKNPTRRKEMGQKARARVERFFSLRESAQAMQVLYRDMLNG